MSILKIRFDRSTKDEIDRAMVDEEHLAEAIRLEPRRPVPGEPGLVMCNLVVPVPRASDPETAQPRRVAVTMSDRKGEVEVVRLDGLRSD